MHDLLTGDVREQGFIRPSTDSQTLTVGVCNKVRVYLQSTKQGEWAAHIQKAQTPRKLLGRVFKGNTCGDSHRIRDFLLIG